MPSITNAINRIRFTNIVLKLIILSVISTFFTFKIVYASDWPQLQNNAQHTGRTTDEVVPSYEVAWAWADKTHIVKNFVSQAGNNIFDKSTGYKFNVVFSQIMQPIVGDSKVFFGSLNGTLYAVNALTGDNLWDYQTGGAIIQSAAYGSGIVVVGSMDGKVYGLNANTGQLVWSIATSDEAGFTSAPTISGSTVFIGDRSGKFYAINLTNGSYVWASQYYNTGAPIISPAAVSENGQIVFVGSENMNFYAFNTATGTLLWGPKKLVGQSFLYSWPVVVGNNVIVRTMSSLDGAEFLMEEVLDSLSAGVAWATEKSSVLSWLSTNPHQKTMYVFNVSTGAEPFQVAMGRVTGNNYVAHLPVVDNQGRVLSYWRSREATLIANTACFGTKYCPDISGVDMTTGDRIKLTNNSGNKIAPELDNGYQLTVGGNYLYMANHFRGVSSINLSTGDLYRITTHSAKWDGGDFRGWGYQIIYYGNDSEPDNTYTNAKPSSASYGTAGFIGVAIANISNVPMLFVNEGDAGFIVAIK